MFEDVDVTTLPSNLVSTLPPIPEVVVIDMALVVGMDVSFVEIFPALVNIFRNSNCSLILSGVCSKHRSMLSFVDVKHGQDGVSFSPELDMALGSAEDLVLSRRFVNKPSPVRKAARGMLQEDKLAELGFLHALHQLDVHHGIEYSEVLSPLKASVRQINMEPGQALYEAPGYSSSAMESTRQRGLFFIEEGTIRVERNPNQTTRAGNFLEINQGSISGLEPRGDEMAAKNAAAKKAVEKREPARRNLEKDSFTFRLARLGPGWVLGATELCCGMRNPGVHVSVGCSKLYFLDYDVIKEIERKDPTLGLYIYKLVSYLQSKSNEREIEQLTMMKSILKTQAGEKPQTRKQRGSIKWAMMQMGTV